MPPSKMMTVNERRKYLSILGPRYRHAQRAECTALFTEMEQVTRLHRKGIVRLLGAPSLERTPQGPRYRRRTYGPEVADVVRVCWESLDYLVRSASRRRWYPPRSSSHSGKNWC